jgi:D-alanine-D-alanine ligase
MGLKQIVFTTLIYKNEKKYIIMGGYSEYKISLISGNVVYQFLDKQNTTDSVYFFKEKWVYVDANDIEL